ncbi:MAG TPA: DUF1566 domain-containing protein [Polyangiaceae bacterium]|nr:DUF1566 domain-containing protein [Polyangiaceae bacterium]
MTRMVVKIAAGFSALVLLGCSSDAAPRAESVSGASADSGAMGHRDADVSDAGSDAGTDGGDAAATRIDAGGGDRDASSYEGDASPFNACAAGTPVCAPAYPCQDLAAPAVGHTCRGQFADWLTTDSPAAFSDNGDGTVTDSRSGLVWQQTVSSDMFTQATAKAYCAQLSLLGAKWRLPTKAELESIVDFTKFSPAIDTTYFPNTPADPFWSSSAYVGAPGDAWLVQFILGSPVNLGADFPGHARCVQDTDAVTLSTGIGGAPPGRYLIDSMNGTVVDTRTQLTWQRGIAPGTHTQPDAVSYCAGLTLAGGGWRLPQVSELLTLVDPTVYNPAIDVAAFPDTPAVWFWTSSAYAGAVDNAWYVTFFYGYSATSPTSSEPQVRCVR